MNTSADTFNSIKQTDANGKSFWNSCNLSKAMDYSEYGKFKRVINKAMNVCRENNQAIDDHFAK